MIRCELCFVVVMGASGPPDWTPPRRLLSPLGGNIRTTATLSLPFNPHSVINTYEICTLSA
jgi:hypothetical protein